MAKTALHDKLAAVGGVTGEYAGAQTIASFGDSALELAALRETCGVFDLGWRGMIILSGEDRVRWLNGMVTNNIRDLAVNHGNYSLLLSAQGRILGDLVAYNRGEYILVTTELSQITAVSEFFDRYIIMDDVEVTDVSDKLTALSVAGPQSRLVLAKAGFDIPEMQPGEVLDADWNNIGLSIARGLGTRGESYDIWFHPDNVAPLWDALASSGATPAGYQALEWLRILNGIPRYGVDMTERYLPQETGQTRALHFAKGCYIGQEIVERIRSRATIHRIFGGLEVEGPAPAPLTPVLAAEKKVGEITSAATIPVGGAAKTFALGYLRVEANTPGNQVQVGEASAKVSALPFQV